MLLFVKNHKKCFVFILKYIKIYFIYRLYIYYSLHRNACKTVCQNKRKLSLVDDNKKYNLANIFSFSMLKQDKIFNNSASNKFLSIVQSIVVHVYHHHSGSRGSIFSDRRNVVACNVIQKRRAPEGQRTILSLVGTARARKL